MSIEILKSNYQYGMRALGSYAGTYHSNTKEGLIKWASKGIRFWEADVAESEDHKYVMIGHFLDEETMKRMEISNLPEKLTYDWFLKQKLFPKSTKGLTPLSLEDILNIAQSEKGYYFMLDLYPFSLEDSFGKTNSFLEYIDKTIKNNNEVFDRLIFEAYNFEMLKALSSFPRIKNIQLSVSFFMKNEGITSIEEFVSIAKNNKVNVISYEWRYAKKHKKHLSLLKDSGFLFISRSITNCFHNRQKKKYGVNIALLDYYVTSFLDLFSLIRLFFSRLLKKHG